MSTQAVLSASERKAFLAALDDPMTDDEAVGLIAELVTLTAAVSKVATQKQQKALLPTLIRAGNMAPYIANRLAAVAELADKAETAAQILHNVIAARQIGEGYQSNLDDLNAALARVQGGAA